MKTTSFRMTGGDWFVAFQVVMAYCFAIPQVMKMFESVRGVTINWLLCATLFIILNLWLSVHSYFFKNERRHSTLQAIILYGNWLILLIPMVILTFVKCPWTAKDSLVFSMVIGSAVIVWFAGHAFGRKLDDPVIRGMLVGLFRVVPHLYLSYCIVKAGHGDIAVTTVVSANITALARIVTLWGEKELRASLWSEVANESSWLVATVVWKIYL